MPRISPDGQEIAYVLYEPGGEQVVVQPFPGPGSRTQVSVAGGTEPVWSRDARKLFYRDKDHLVAATVSTSPSFSITSREQLFRDGFLRAEQPHANYDVAPDGKSFLFLKTSEDAQAMVVYNWFDEVRSKLAQRREK